jgi:hypothetical protein
MRTDMRKVLIERPRIGHSRRYHDIRARQNRTEFEDMPSCEGMRRPHRDRKEFSDLLGPLRSYLWSCRGRHWDDVWSEISAQLSNNTVDSHLKHIHVPQFIEIHTELVDGKVYSRNRRRFHSSHEIIDGLYVHPVTGLVCGEIATLVKKPKAFFLDDIAYDKGEDGVLRPKNWFNRRYTSTKYSRKIIGFEREAVYVNGFWYWVIFASVPAPSVDNSVVPSRVINHTCTDFVTGALVREGRYRADKRQMGALDLRRHGLVNA